MAKKKLPKSNKPKPRHVWKINPTTRVKPSSKTYDRAKNLFDWFGDEA